MIVFRIMCRIVNTDESYDVYADNILYLTHDDAETQRLHYIKKSKHKQDKYFIISEEKHYEKNN